MKFFAPVLAAALVGSASAFAPSSQNAVSSSTTALSAASDMPGATKPLGFWDPLGLADLGSESTLTWFRAAELKHSRCAMVAFVGYLFGAAGLHFPGQLSSDVSFESLASMKPFDAWTAVPAMGQAQIIGTIFLAEVITEAKSPHYLKGGEYPTVVFPPINFAPSDPAALRSQQDRELNNGRAAMIGMAGFIAADNVPGSVPLMENFSLSF